MAMADSLHSRSGHGMGAGSIDAESPATPMDHLGALALLAVVFSGFIASLGDFSRVAIVTGAMLVLATLAVTKASGRTSQWALSAFGLSVLWYCLSSFYDQSFQLDMNYYVAPIVGLGAFSIHPKVLTRYIVGAVFVQVSAQLYEWVTGNFIYYAIGKYDNELYTEQMFEGSAGVFRSKGMFEASTVMGASLVYFSVITRFNILVILMGIFSCILGYARLGLTLDVALLVILLFSSFDPRRIILVMGLVVVSTLVGYYSFSIVTSGDFNLEFIYSTFDTGSSQNDSRIEFWFRGIDFVQSMNAGELIFGAASRYFAEIGNSAENAWMNILALAGLPMLLIYLSACFWFARGNRYSLAAQGVIFISCMIASNFQSLATCVLFWLTALAASRPIAGTGWGMRRAREQGRDQPVHRRQAAV